jgi:hypothetical protein
MKPRHAAALDAGTDWYRIRRWLAYFGSAALIWTIFFVPPPQATHHCAVHNPTEISVGIIFSIYSFMFLSLGFDRWKRAEMTKAVIASCALLLLGLRDFVSAAGITCPVPAGASLRDLVGSVLRLSYILLAIMTYHLAIQRSSASSQLTN